MIDERPMKAAARKPNTPAALRAVGAAVLVGALAFSSCTRSRTTEKASPSPSAGQKTFGTPEQAADALIQAATSFDVPALLAIFGPEGEDLVSTGDPVQAKNGVEAFLSKAREKSAVVPDPDDPGRAILQVGPDDWPLPIPIVKKGTAWFFDSRAGRDEILFRRIGGNELDAIQICRGFVEAQKEYALEVRDDSGVNQYAQKIISTPGKKDGLYWENEDGTPGGPISQAIARAIEEGYSTSRVSGYHGYYFKVLKGQGPAAPMGPMDYVIKGMMIGGFALVAVPIEYRVTGVKTFIVSHDGIVYEKDLGPGSLDIVRAMELYDPDSSWRRTDDDWDK